MVVVEEEGRRQRPAAAAAHAPGANLTRVGRLPRAGLRVLPNRSGQPHASDLDSD